MNNRLLIATIGLTILTACTNEATGQKGRVVLKTQMDSVSYSMGADIGKNLMQQMPQELLDTLNNAALAEGIRLGIF